MHALRRAMQSIPMHKMSQETKETLNQEKIPRTPNGQIELQYITYGNKKNIEPDINEFICTGLIGHDKYPYVTTQYCEDKAMNTGCKEIENCEDYKKQKELQKKHPEINWEQPDKNKPEEITRIRMIKKGAIILPETKK